MHESMSRVYCACRMIRWSQSIVMSAFPLETIVELHVYRCVFQRVVIFVNLIKCRLSHTDAIIWTAGYFCSIL